MRFRLCTSAVLCAAVSSQVYNAGITLELQLCSPTSSLQQFSFPPGTGGPISLAANASLCIEAYSGGEYGWPALMQLQVCKPLQSMQNFVVDSVAGTIRTNNTAIEGCWTFNREGAGTPRAGQNVFAFECNAEADELFDINSPSPGLMQARNVDGTKPSGFCVSVKQPNTTYILDDTAANAIGPRFDGIGLVAGAGSSRLLYDYPAVEQGLILDSLFLPTHAGSGLHPHILKIEIGGDGMGTSGSEPSHQHYSGEASQAGTRGTQVWLAQQAKLRNPDILIYALPWSWPGWLKQSPSDLTPFSDPNAAAAYVRDWLLAVQSTVGGFTVDYVGIWSDIWDATLSPAYVKALRTYLDGSGLSSVQIVCADVNDWGCAKEALADPALLTAVGVFGNHGYPGNDEPKSTGKPIWFSWMHDGDAANTQFVPETAASMNNAYVRSGLTAVIPYAALGASYNVLPEWNSGAILADAPWTGWWKPTPLWYAVAHHTQFALPGWMHLNVGVGSGALTNGGTYITRVMGMPPYSWSTVITKTGDKGAVAEWATFQLAGNLRSNSPTIYVRSSCFGAATAQNASFFRILTVTPDAEGMFSVWLQQNCMYSLTNVMNAGKAPVTSNPTAPSPFPTSISADFSSTTPGRPGRFWSDINGAFEVVNDPAAGFGLQQMSMSKPITRRGTDTRPHTILGDPTWIDTDFVVQFFLPTSTDSACICVRCNNFNDTAGVDGSTGADEMPGLWLCMSPASWVVQVNLRSDAAPIRTGTLVTPIQPGSRHSLRLTARGDVAIGAIDGIIIFKLVGLFTAGAPSKGFIGLGAGAFGQKPIFISYAYTVSGTACSATPVQGVMPHDEPCQAGMPGQQLTYTPGPNAGWGQFQLSSNTSLCMHMNSTADPDFKAPKTKAVGLQPCNGTEARQFFMVETTIQDTGGAPSGPITGVDGLTLNVWHASERDDSEITGYLYKGGTNAYWYWDAATGSIYSSFMGTCLSFCDTI